jgi:hypothetical protein
MPFSIYIRHMKINLPSLSLNNVPDTWNHSNIHAYDSISLKNRIISVKILNKIKKRC